MPTVPKATTTTPVCMAVHVTYNYTPQGLNSADQHRLKTRGWKQHWHSLCGKKQSTDIHASLSYDTTCVYFDPYFFIYCPVSAPLSPWLTLSTVSCWSQGTRETIVSMLVIKETWQRSPLSSCKSLSERKTTTADLMCYSLKTLRLYCSCLQKINQTSE